MKTLKGFAQLGPQGIQPLGKSARKSRGGFRLLLDEGGGEVGEGRLLEFHPCDKAFTEFALRRFDAVEAFVLCPSCDGETIGDDLLAGVEALVLLAAGGEGGFRKDGLQFGDACAEAVLEVTPEGIELPEGGLCLLPLGAFEECAKALDFLAQAAFGVIQLWFQRRGRTAQEQDHQDSDLQDDDADQGGYLQGFGRHDWVLGGH